MQSSSLMKNLTSFCNFTNVCLRFSCGAIGRFKIATFFFFCYYTIPLSQRVLFAFLVISSPLADRQTGRALFCLFKLITPPSRILPSSPGTTPSCPSAWSRRTCPFVKAMKRLKRRNCFLRGFIFTTESFFNGDPL